MALAILQNGLTDLLMGENENGLQSTSEESASDCVSADQNEVDGFIRG